MNSQTIEADTSNPELMPVVRAEQPMPPPSLFGTNDPVAVIGKARAVADALKSVIKAQRLISNIGGKEYPRCEAWTLLGTMLGVFPVLIWTRHVENGWEARVEARTRDGAVVGCAEAQCLSTERNWSNRDDFALRSMAQTRATAKCLRMPLGFVMTLSGFEATPAEEMTFERSGEPDHHRGTPQPSKRAGTPAAAPTGKPKRRPEATPEQREKLIKVFSFEGTDAVQRACGYFIEIGAIMPTEGLAELPLRFVPVTAGELRELGALIAELADTGKAKKPSWILGAGKGSELPPMGNAPASQVDNAAPVHSKSAPVPTNSSASSEWFLDVIVPIPHKGQKRDEYLRDPDTIGSLYNARHENKDMRSRLWGFVNHYEPKPWTKKDGTPMPPSDTDVNFRAALDDFAAWFEKRHPDEKL